MLASNLPRYPLAFLPTPLSEMPRLSEQLGGPRLWIKRDDMTGLAGGGNKTRKLEFLIADALAQGADTVLTVGAAQSNHCRQTAAAAAKAGLACHLVLNGQPPARAQGNLLLDELLGAELHWTTYERRMDLLHELTGELRARGQSPYPITIGGSDPVGATGYAVAVEELRAQCDERGLRPAAIVFASSSGGTHAGLVTGARALSWGVPLVGISIDEPAPLLQQLVADLAGNTAAHLGLQETFTPEEIRVRDGYLGEGYGIVGDLERDAITLLARCEGIFLDPVYTGRAFGGLLDLVRRGQFGPGQDVIFWHTGGTPALFAYARELLGA
jgi:L-cysteate sulfo-lyase